MTREPTLTILVLGRPGQEQRLKFDALVRQLHSLGVEVVADIYESRVTTSWEERTESLGILKDFLETGDLSGQIAILTANDFINAAKVASIVSELSQRRNGNASDRQVYRWSIYHEGDSWQRGGSLLARGLLAPVQSQQLIMQRDEWLLAIGASIETEQELLLTAMANARQAVYLGNLEVRDEADRSYGDMLTQIHGTDGALSLLARAATLSQNSIPQWRRLLTPVFELVISIVILSGQSHSSGAAEKLAAIREPLLEDVQVDRVRPRVAEVLHTLGSGSIQLLKDALRLRILVAGHDLKFIDFVYRYLPGDVVVREDRWQSERKHDVSKSREGVQWADIVWVEWLGQCAVWYSSNVGTAQILIVRQHRYELTRDAGHHVDYDKVLAVVVIAVHTGEGVVEKFDVPRDKIRYIPNVYEEGRYRLADVTDDSRQYRLALVGSVPRWKGLHRALEVLRLLRAHDTRYTLTIFGRQPSELTWVADDIREAAYFEACETYASSPELAGAVSYAGWVDLRDELRNYGYVLSTSDFEGSHVSPGEAYMVGNAGVFLRWRGSEYIYPEEFGFEMESEMADYISGGALFRPDVRESIVKARTFLAENQGVSAFFSAVHRLIMEARP